MSTDASASVVASSLVSFMPGVTPAMRENVQLALLFADRATATVAQEGSAVDTYDYYRNQLRYLGWDAQPALESAGRAADRRTLVDEAMAAIRPAGPAYQDSTRWALNALQDNPTVLFRFEERSVSSRTFRLVPCQYSRGSYLDLVLYQQALARDQLKSGFLSFERKTVAGRAELVRFNLRLFESEFKARVLKGLKGAIEKEVLYL